MRKRLQLIFFAAALAASGIILSQFYWVYYNYKVGRSNFITTANYALQKSIDAYELSQNKLPTSLEYKAPSLTVFMRTIPDQEPMVFDTPGTVRRFNAEFMTVAIDTNNLDQIKGLIARLLSQKKQVSMNADTLSSIFHQTLRRNGITDTFKLTITPYSKHLAVGGIYELVNFSKAPVLVRAELLHPGQFLFKHNFFPALASCILILLSAGSLFYMWRIIRNQMRLDSMKTDFINNITHELRTPISILKASNEAMTNFGAADDPSSLRRYLETNASVLDNMNDNIERILDFSKAENKALIPKFQLVNLPRLANEVIQRLTPAKHSPIVLTYSLPTPLVSTDEFFIGTILGNLLDNALKYGGPEIGIGIGPLANGWRITVSDNGGNIPPQSLSYIFDKFYRVQTGDLHDTKGYGLGLAYVRQLVYLLDGRITASSTPGIQTVFTITLPNHEQ